MLKEVKMKAEVPMFVPRMPGFTAEASLPGSDEEMIVFAIKHGLAARGWKLVRIEDNK